MFAFLGMGLAQIFEKVVSVRVETLSNTDISASEVYEKANGLFLLTCVAQKAPWHNLLILL